MESCFAHAKASRTDGNCATVAATKMTRASTEARLPLSFQIVGKRFADATVLRAADSYERATPWRERRPAL